jgi:hypothetical protein
MVGVIGATKEVDSYLTEFEGLKTGRLDFERKWQMVSDYILPRRDFSITKPPNQLRPHKVTSSVATGANRRMAALMLAYMIGQHPFLMPNVKRGLAAAGRDVNIDDAGMDYLGQVQWSIFDHLMLPRAQLMLRMSSMLNEFCAFGNGVIWTGRRRGFGPYFNARPLQACWWSENDEGVIDTLYCRIMLPLHRVFERYPEARNVEGWGEDRIKPGHRDEQELTTILLACRPRQGGIAGAVVEAKPFAYVAIAEEKKAILERSGYDSFPYGVFRYNPFPGDAYAEGPGCEVLPDVMVLNHMWQGIENVASQKGDPPIAVPARMFGKTLDRRPGAVNAYNPAGLGLQRADQAILKFDLTGDISEAMAVTGALRDNIELGYFVDWLRLRESGDMTAEEVGERRDMRLRGMSSIVANCEQPMTALGDRSLEIMGEERLLAPAPPSVAGAEVDWEYAGPLAIAQLRGNVQSTLQIINTRELVAKQDPAAAEAVDLEESLRTIAEGLAVPTRNIKSRQFVAAKRQKMAEEQQQQADAAKAATAGQALRDGGAGVASLADAAQNQQLAA